VRRRNFSIVFYGSILKLDLKDNTRDFSRLQNQDNQREMMLAGNN
jgi:hypothetical protein